MDAQYIDTMAVANAKLMKQVEELQAQLAAERAAKAWASADPLSDSLVSSLLNIQKAYEVLRDMYLPNAKDGESVVLELTNKKMSLLTQDKGERV
jgi:hypothetical protein